jgi:hypothetical protein
LLFAPSPLWPNALSLSLSLRHQFIYREKKNRHTTRGTFRTFPFLEAESVFPYIPEGIRYVRKLGICQEEEILNFEMFFFCFLSIFILFDCSFSSSSSSSSSSFRSLSLSDDLNRNHSPSTRPIKQVFWMHIQKTSAWIGDLILRLEFILSCRNFLCSFFLSFLATHLDLI